MIMNSTAIVASETAAVTAERSTVRKHPAHVKRDAILRVENVTVTFSGFKALTDLSFALEPGELRVVIGPNGAGKSTLLDVITGKTRPAKGRVLFKGENITRLQEQQ